MSKKLSRHLAAPYLDRARIATKDAEQAMVDRDASIVAAIQSGVSITDLAEAAGVHRTRIYQIYQKAIDAGDLEFGTNVTEASVLDTDVYFMEANGYIKIGRAKDVHKRLGTIRSGYSGINYPESVNRKDIRLIASTRGNRRIERNLHLRFKHLHVTGEWFTDCAELRNHIATLEPAA